MLKTNFHAVKRTWGEFTTSPQVYQTTCKFAGSFHAHQTMDRDMVHAPSMKYVVLVCVSKTLVLVTLKTHELCVF